MRGRSSNRSSVEALPLLGAKLLPPAPGPFHLDRARLHERLASGLEGRATVVLAGPGYGKTSLVARFVQGLGGDFVWYSLDAADRDPWLFCRYLVQGIQEHVPEFGERSTGLWKDPRPPSQEIERLVDTVLSDAEESLGGRMVVVLDGIHDLESSPACTRALQRLLAYLPGTLHLVLVGRSLPDLEIQALVADGAVNVLRAEELLFTRDETRTLLVDLFGLRVQPDTLDKVHTRTRGWVTALRLLRQTARLEASSPPDLPEDVFTRTESEIFDYFSEEVLASESPSAREFLLGSSPPDFIDPEICAEVLKDHDVRTSLALLLKRNLFVSPLESRSEYYAYDPLFRDFLRRKLRSEKGAKGKRDLDRRYGKAFARRGAFTEAVTHWIAADEVEGVTDLLRRHGQGLLRAGMLDAVLEAAQFVAAHGVRSAVVEGLLGEALRLSGDHAAAVGHFEKALSAASKDGPELTGSARANTLQGLAYSLVKKGEPARAAEVAEKALAEAGDEDRALLARILNTLSIIRYRENRLQEAASGWQEALERARQAGDHHLVLMIAHNLGLPHAVMGDFRRASECFQILTGPDNPRVGPQEGAAYLNLARIATIRGEFAHAASLLQDAQEIARKWRLSSFAADVLEAEGNLLRESGELDAAAEKYARARKMFTELGQQDVSSNVEEEVAILTARRGEHEDAKRIGASVLERARAANDPDRLASSLLALGEIHVRAGEPSPAKDLLEESVALFRSLGRAYQECMAGLWLALACHRARERPRAEAAATDALRLAVKFDYRGPVLKVARLDEGFLRLLGALPAAPAYLMEPSALEEPSAGERIKPGGADLTIKVLGPIEIFRDAEMKIPAAAWKIKRALQIFCLLAGSRNHRASKDRIVDALWGNVRPSAVEKNFHPTISFLRAGLNHGHRVSKNFVIYEKGFYLLNPAYRYDIDAETFEEKIRSARGKALRADVPGALADYDAALALYQGPFLEEEYSEWTEAPRAHLESLYRAALTEGADLHLRGGDAEAGIALLKELVEQEPLDEDVSCRLMKAFAGRGNRGGVEKEYRRLVQALEKDLQTRPLPETRRVYEEALAAKPAPSDASPDRSRPARGGRQSAGGNPSTQRPR